MLQKLFHFLCKFEKKIAWETKFSAIDFCSYFEFANFAVKLTELSEELRC